MRKLALLVLLTLIPMVYYAQNLLNNGDFEMGKNYGSEWIGTNFGIERTNIIDGAYSLELGTTYGLASIYQSFPATTAGSFYSLICSAKTKAGQQGSFILQYNKGTEWVNFKYVPITNTITDRYELAFTAEENTSYRVYFYCATGNKIWVDNVELNPAFLFSVGKDIISTSIGTLDVSNKSILDIPRGLVTVKNLKEGLVLSNMASVCIFNGAKIVNDNDIVTESMSIKVFSEKGDNQTYSIKTTNKNLRYTRMGVLNSNSISGIVPTLTVTDFIKSLIVYEGATVEVLEGGVAVANPSTTLISSTMTLKITGTDGNTTYTLGVSAPNATLSMYITSVPFGYVDENAWQIRVPTNTYVWQFKGLVKVTSGYNFDIIGFDGNSAPIESDLYGGMKIQVGIKEYNVVIDENALSPTTINGQKISQSSLLYPYILNGKTEMHFTSSAPIVGGTVNFNSEDAWVFFDNVKPSVVAANYLSYMSVKDKPAVLDQNVRVVQYNYGAVVIPHSSDYKPLSVYSGINLEGTSAQLGIDYFTGVAGLGSMHENIKSFKLKHGYMATFAQESDGRGFSKVYIANDSDLVVNLPAKLNSVSFIRVIKWRWPHKKGNAHGSEAAADTMNCSWWYNWDNASNSTLNREYIPMRHNLTWNNFENINNRTNSTHVLGYNEPNTTNMKKDGVTHADNYATVAQAIAQWPNLMASGLRIGAPAPTDADPNGWLYPFIAQCDALGYRVDFVALHWYRVGTASAFYNFIKDVHTKTGRPIWITEFGYGADWTCCDPASNEANASMIQSYINMLDTVSYVERYSIFNLDNGNLHRKVFDIDTITRVVSLTETGTVYKAKTSKLAYSSKQDNFYTNYASLAYTNILNNTLPTASWTLQSVDSQEMSASNEAPATNAFDRDISTIWHTQWNAAAPVNPHEIQIFLGDTFKLKDLIYLPRQIDGLNGTIANFEFYTSLDGVNWDEPIIAGKWGNDNAPKMMSCGNIAAQYIKLVSKSEVNGKAFASAAEIALTGMLYTPSAPEPTTPPIVTTNISDVTKNSLYFSIYPNPTSNKQFYILSPNLNNEKVEVSVIGIEGKVIYEGKKTIANNIIDVNLNQDVAAGIYFVKITSKNTTYTKKVIVK